MEKINKEGFKGIGHIAPLLQSDNKSLIDKQQSEVSIAEYIASHAFNASAPPPESDSLIFLNGVEIGSRSNIVSVTGRSKSRKSVIVSAMMAACMNQSANVLGFSSSLSSDDEMIHIDTEQSHQDYWHGVDRTIRWSRLGHPPKNLHSIYARDADTTMLWSALDHLFEKIKPTIAFIDGIADFITDINDNEQVSLIGRHLLKLSSDHNTLIVVVIHTTKQTGYMTGALGTWFEKKSETVLKCDKPDDQKEITNVSCQYARGADFPDFAITMDQETHEYKVVQAGQMVNKSDNHDKRRPDNFLPEDHSKVLHRVFLLSSRIPDSDIRSKIAKHAQDITGFKFSGTMVNKWLDYYQSKTMIYCDPDNNWLKAEQPLLQPLHKQDDLPF